MDDGADILPADLDSAFVNQARALRSEASVVVLPLKEVGGIGIYPLDTLTLVKRLRSTGVDAAYLHDSEHRRFVVRNSAIAVVGAFLLGIASNAGWDGIKALLRGRNRSAADPPLDVTYLDLETPDCDIKAWRAAGDTEAVLEAIDKLRGSSEDVLTQGAETLAPPAPGAAFDTAGADQDLRSGYLREQIVQRRQTGDELLAASKAALASDPPDRVTAEQHARNALSMYARSLDWAEDTPGEDEAHRRMDAAGKWVRQTFGCRVERNGTTYKETCPVALAHNRLGFSIGGSAQRICSLCGQDLSECEHLTGTAYMVPGGPNPLGWCRVCLKQQCEHSPDELYRVSVVSMIEELDVDEVSLVTKPRQPEARLLAVSVPIQDLQAEFGDSFVPGMEIRCDKCLSPCTGLTKHDALGPH